MKKKSKFVTTITLLFLVVLLSAGFAQDDNETALDEFDEYINENINEHDEVELSILKMASDHISVQ